MVSLTIQTHLSALTPSHGRPSLDMQAAAQCMGQADIGQDNL
jgi:hypothetical protein